MSHEKAIFDGVRTRLGVRKSREMTLRIHRLENNEYWKDRSSPQTSDTISPIRGPRPRPYEPVLAFRLAPLMAIAVRLGSSPHRRCHRRYRVVSGARITVRGSEAVGNCHAPRRQTRRTPNDEISLRVLGSAFDVAVKDLAAEVTRERRRSCALMFDGEDWQKVEISEVEAERETASAREEINSRDSGQDFPNRFCRLNRAKRNSSCIPTNGSASAACSCSGRTSSVRRDQSVGCRRSRNHPSARQSGGVYRSRTVVVTTPLLEVRIVVTCSRSAPPCAASSIRPNDSSVRIAMAFSTDSRNSINGPCRCSTTRL